MSEAKIVAVVEQLGNGTWRPRILATGLAGAPAPKSEWVSTKTYENKEDAVTRCREVMATVYSAMSNRNATQGGGRC